MPYNKEYYEKNKERVKARVRSYYKGYRKENYEKNRERLKEYNKNYHQKYKAIKRERIYNDENRYKTALLHSIRMRSNKKKLPFSLTKEDLNIPLICPVLGIVLQRGRESGMDCSPSVDRIIPELGYVSGNIVIVSNRANRIRSNATIKELKQIYDFYKKLGVP